MKKLKSRRVAYRSPCECEKKTSDQTGKRPVHDVPVFTNINRRDISRICR